MCLVSFLELTENEVCGYMLIGAKLNCSLQVMFYSVESVLGQFLDVDHLLSLCIKIPKNDNMKTAESKITKVCYSYCLIVRMYSTITNNACDGCNRVLYGAHLMHTDI